MAYKVQMRDSTVKTIDVPVIGPNGDPATVTILVPSVQRVVVRNVGPVALILAHTSNELQKAQTPSSVFIIPPLLEETFVLAPEQGLFVVAQGLSGRASIAISDAWAPFEGAELETC